METMENRKYYDLSNRMKAMIKKIEMFNQSGIMEGKVEVQDMACLKQQLLVQCDAKYASVLEGDLSFRKGFPVDLQRKMNAYQAKMMCYNQFVQMANQASTDKLRKSTPTIHSGECSSRIESALMQPVISYTSFIDGLLKPEFSDRGNSTPNSDLHHSSVDLCPRCEYSLRGSPRKNIETPTKEHITGTEMCTDVSESKNTSQDGCHKTRRALTTLNDVRKTGEERASGKLIRSAKSKQKHKSEHQYTSAEKVTDSSLSSPNKQSNDNKRFSVSDISQINDGNERLDEKRNISYKQTEQNQTVRLDQKQTTKDQRKDIKSVSRNCSSKNSPYLLRMKPDGTTSSKKSKTVSTSRSPAAINSWSDDSQDHMTHTRSKVGTGNRITARKGRRGRRGNASLLTKQNPNLKDANITTMLRHNTPNASKYTSSEETTDKDGTKASLEQQTMCVNIVEPEAILGGQPGQKISTSRKGGLHNDATETQTQIEPETMNTVKISSANKYANSEKALIRKKGERNLTIASPADRNKAKHQMIVANCKLDTVEINGSNKTLTASSIKIAKQNTNITTEELTTMLASSEAEGPANTSTCQLFVSESIFMPGKMPYDASSTECEVMNTSSGSDTYQYNTNGKILWKRKIMLLKSNSSLIDQNTNSDTTEPMTLNTSCESEATANNSASLSTLGCIGTDDNTTHNNNCRFTPSTNNYDKVEHEMHISASLCEFRDSSDDVSLTTTLTCVSSCISQVLPKQGDPAKLWTCTQHLCSTTQQNSDVLVNERYNGDSLHNVAMQETSLPQHKKKKRTFKWPFKFHRSFFNAFTFHMQFPKFINN